MNTLAVIFQEPEHLALSELELASPGLDDVVVDIEWSGISAGTERLLWLGQMPDFPGLGYPLVPGYESVGRVVSAGPDAAIDVGQRVFVPGANCFGAVRGLFGGAASRLVVPSRRVVPIADGLGERGVLLALAATARHVLIGGTVAMPDLIVGHGVLGRLIARLVLALGGPPPRVWETNPVRSSGPWGYEVLHPDDDDKNDYRVICDVSGDPSILDSLVARLASGGEIVLGGFYKAPLSFAFPPAFMREARIRVSAEWKLEDLTAVTALIDNGRLSLAGLITHRKAAPLAEDAYASAFADPDCLKMVLDWRYVS